MRPSLFLTGLLASGAQAVTRGINLGGWLILEPWITPTLFNITGSPPDEWTLCNTLGRSKCLDTFKNHWDTFFTRDDFVAMKNAGLNAVRIPVGYWAVDLMEEPYVQGQYPYLLRAIQWAKEMGFTVLVDLHAAPGSQNGWEQTGLVGPINFPANQSNTDRALKVLQNFTTEFSQSQYRGVVTGIELMNEPIFAFDLLTKFYTLGANIVSKAAPYINVTISDAFLQPHTWANYDPNNPSATKPAPNITLDTHQFWGFPPLDKLTQTQVLERVCDFGQMLRNSTDILPVVVGEWSLNSGVTGNSSSNTEDDQPKRTWFRRLFESQVAAYSPNGPGQNSIGWYFWCWKTEYDIDAWSYRKGLQLGYIPSNVSNSSTFEFPILADGCIDLNHAYTAPAKASSSPINTAAPAGTTGSSGGGQTGAAPAKASAALSSAFVAGSWLAVVSLLFIGIA